MTDDDDVAMRNLIIFAVVAMAVAVAIIPAEGTDADGVAEVYFFNEEGDCIAQVYLIPGDKIGDKLPPLSSVKGWYDDDATRITMDSSFDAGVHVIREHSSVTPPEPPDRPTDNSGLIIGAVAVVIGILAIGAVIYCLRK